MTLKHSPPPARVVCDTNTVLSALVFTKGKLVTLRHAWQAQRFIPIASKETVTELVRVLGYPKFGITPQDQQKLLTDYLPFVETHTPHLKADSFKHLPQCRDPKDQMFLNLAHSAQADYLVTGDQDLLVLHEPLHKQRVFKICTPAVFLADLENPL